MVSHLKKKMKSKWPNVQFLKAFRAHFHILQISRLLSIVLQKDQIFYHDYIDLYAIVVKWNALTELADGSSSFQ